MSFTSLNDFYQQFTQAPNQGRADRLEQLFLKQYKDQRLRDFLFSLAKGDHEELAPLRKALERGTQGTQDPLEISPRMIREAQNYVDGKGNPGTVKRMLDVIQQKLAKAPPAKPRRAPGLTPPKPTIDKWDLSGKDPKTFRVWYTQLAKAWGPDPVMAEESWPRVQKLLKIGNEKYPKVVNDVVDTLGGEGPLGAMKDAALRNQIPKGVTAATFRMVAVEAQRDPREAAESMRRLLNDDHIPENVLDQLPPEPAKKVSKKVAKKPADAPLKSEAALNARRGTQMPLRPEWRDRKVPRAFKDWVSEYVKERALPEAQQDKEFLRELMRVGEERYSKTGTNFAKNLADDPKKWGEVYDLALEGKLPTRLTAGTLKDALIVKDKDGNPVRTLKGDEQVEAIKDTVVKGRRSKRIQEKYAPKSEPKPSPEAPKPTPKAAPKAPALAGGLDPSPKKKTAKVSARKPREERAPRGPRATAQDARTVNRPKGFKDWSTKVLREYSKPVKERNEANLKVLKKFAKDSKFDPRAMTFFANAATNKKSPFHWMAKAATDPGLFLARSKAWSPAFLGRALKNKDNPRTGQILREELIAEGFVPKEALKSKEAYNEAIAELDRKAAEQAAEAKKAKIISNAEARGETPAKKARAKKVPKVPRAVQAPARPRGPMPAPALLEAIAPPAAAQPFLRGGAPAAASPAAASAADDAARAIAGAIGAGTWPGQRSYYRPSLEGTSGRSAGQTPRTGPSRRASPRRKSRLEEAAEFERNARGPIPEDASRRKPTGPAAKPKRARVARGTPIADEVIEARIKASPLGRIREELQELQKRSGVQKTPQQILDEIAEELNIDDTGNPKARGRISKIAKSRIRKANAVLGNNNPVTLKGATALEIAQEVAEAENKIGADAVRRRLDELADEVAPRVKGGRQAVMDAFLDGEKVVAEGTPKLRAAMGRAGVASKTTMGAERIIRGALQKGGLGALAKRPGLYGVAATVAGAVAPWLAGQVSDFVSDTGGVDINQGVRNAQIARDLAKAEERRNAVRAQVAQNYTRLMQKFPHHYNELLAGQPLEQGAFLLGKPPRPELVEQLASDMASGELRPTQLGSLMPMNPRNPVSEGLSDALMFAGGGMR